MPCFSVDSRSRDEVLHHRTITREQLLSRARRRVRFLMWAPYLLGALVLALLVLMGLHYENDSHRTVLITLGWGCGIGLGAYALGLGRLPAHHPDFRQACRDEMDRMQASAQQCEHIAQACSLDPAIALHVQALRQQGRIWDNALAEKCRRYVSSWEACATQ